MNEDANELAGCAVSPQEMASRSRVAVQTELPANVLAQWRAADAELLAFLEEFGGK